MEINKDVEWMLRIGAAVSGGWNEKEEVVLRLYYDMECNNARTFSHGLIRQYFKNYGVIPIAGLHLFLYLSGFFRFFLFYSFHCVNQLLFCWNIK